ncbi:uncharacterized protein LOC144665361 isoform X2 [Oculina patagonica]
MISKCPLSILERCPSYKEFGCSKMTEKRQGASPGVRLIEAGVFMVFSIASSVLGVIIVTFYSMAIGDKVGHFGDNEYDARMAICAVILTLGIAEFIIGIWAAVCCCLMKPYACCVVTPPPEGQWQAYPLNHTSSNCEFPSAGYVMVQGPGGVPKLFPVEPGSNVIAVQASVAHGGQLPMILAPTFAAVGGVPQPGFVPMVVPVQADGCAFIVQPSISQPQ